VSDNQRGFRATKPTLASRNFDHSNQYYIYVVYNITA